MNSQDRQARIIAAGLFVSLFFVWGGGYNTSPVFLGALLPASVVIANWFGERRGTALGLATAGMESGGMAMAFMTGHIISQYGWRAAYFALSIPTLVLVLPLLAIVVRTRPAGAAKQKVGEPGQALAGYEVGEAIRTRVFWMLAVAQLTWGLSAGAVIHIVAYLTGIGYTMGFATTVFAMLAGLAALGKPTMGALGDRIGGKNALGIALLLIAVSHILILGARHGWMIVLYLLVARSEAVDRRARCGKSASPDPGSL